MPAERMRIPLATLLRRDAAPGRRPVCEDADRETWLVRVAAWQAAFLAQPGDDHALHHEDGFEFSAALFGGWRAGKTLWLPGDLLPETLARLDQRVQGRAGALPGGIAPDATPGSAASAAAAAGSTLAPATPEATEATPETAPPADTQTAPELDPARCRLVLFTSGSTGEPGAIHKTLRQLDSEVAALEAQFGAAVGDAIVQGTVSHQHIYGLLFRLLWPLSAGRPFARRRLAFNEQLAALGPRPLVLVASPAHLKRLPDTQDWSGLASGLRAVFSSGGPLPADAAHDVVRLWRQAAIEVFGSTETGGIAWRQSGGLAKPWRPLPGVSWRLEAGLLAIRSPHLPDEGWHGTADRAVATPDGGFELRGRADRIVKIEERRISLSAIERRLGQSPLVELARVLPLPGHRILLAVAAVPSPLGRAALEAEGKPAIVAQLRAWLADHADAIALPRRWRFLAALPQDPQGKTSERALAALFRPLLPTPDWQRREPALAQARLRVGAELAAFEGHFPQASILPGVAMLDWATRLGREAFAIAAPVQRLETIKFMHLVRPGAELVLDLDWHPAQSLLGFRFQSAAGVHSSGRIRFHPQAGA